MCFYFMTTLLYMMYYIDVIMMQLELNKLLLKYFQRDDGHDASEKNYFKGIHCLTWHPN